MMESVGGSLKRKGVAFEGIPSECPGVLGRQDGGVDCGSLAFASAINETAPEERDSSGAKQSV